MLRLQDCAPDPFTYPQEAVGAAAEYPVHIADRGLSPRRRTGSTSVCGGGCALDVVVEALYDVPSGCLFEVLRLDAQYVLLEL